ncbi:MAG: hypothetical protein Ct9H300mP1_23260 [Planctomycetaceae bacterium]|nr:MAG: hypothetical protein Ct9H300mP1_23260 [Planctomycetaceae bacterium]
MLPVELARDGQHHVGDHIQPVDRDSRGTPVPTAVVLSTKRRIGSPRFPSVLEPPTERARTSRPALSSSPAVLQLVEFLDTRQAPGGPEIDQGRTSRKGQNTDRAGSSRIRWGAVAGVRAGHRARPSVAPPPGPGGHLGARGSCRTACPEASPPPVTTTRGESPRLGPPPGHRIVNRKGPSAHRHQMHPLARRGPDSPAGGDKRPRGPGHRPGFESSSRAPIASRLPKCPAGGPAGPLPRRPLVPEKTRAGAVRLVTHRSRSPSDPSRPTPPRGRLGKIEPAG